MTYPSIMKERFRSGMLRWRMDDRSGNDAAIFYDDIVGKQSRCNEM